MKKLLLLLALSIATTAVASAQEKVVTGTITFLNPSSMNVLDEFVASHEYTGSSAIGLSVKLGAIYRRQDNLSWDLYYTGYNRPSLLGNSEWPLLSNPASTQTLDYSVYNFGYGTYYHWQFGKKLLIKTGGMLDFYGAMKKAEPDAINNAVSLEGQIMLKAHAAIKYGWDFEKWALDLRASVSLPLFGMITADHPSEGAVTILGGNDHSAFHPAYNHIFFGSYHNYMSLDYDLAVDFVCRPCTFSLGLGSTRKWWNVYELQNIRTINYLSIGVSFDIVSRSQFKKSNKNF